MGKGLELNLAQQQIVGGRGVLVLGGISQGEVDSSAAQIALVQGDSV
jgi:hypothetical protein